MRTWGLDLSTQPSNVGLVCLEWVGSEPAALVPTSFKPFPGGRTWPSRAHLAQLIESTIKSPEGTHDIWAVDVPFGWPEAFIDFLVKHGAPPEKRGQTLPIDVPTGSEAKTPWEVMGRRDADRHALKRLERHTGFSVSFDKLGATAAAWATIESALRAGGVRIDRSGRAGQIVETWPSACWTVLGLPGNPATMTGSAFAKALHGVVHLTGHEALIDGERGSHTRDAVVCALAARARQLGRTVEPPSDARGRDRAEREGWIHLPVAGLKLADLVPLPGS